MTELPPPDRTPRKGITPEVASLLAENAGQPVTVHWPGEVIEDADGIPVA